MATATAPRTSAQVPVRPSPYWPTYPPSEHQAAGLALNHVLEVLYGGAAGGGKSDWLLREALQYADCPDYSAILFRRSYTELAKPGALMDRARQWLAETDA